MLAEMDRLVREGVARIAAETKVELQRLEQIFYYAPITFDADCVASVRAGLAAGELAAAVAPAPPGSLSPSRDNYVAAMVEYACGRGGIPPPAWTRAIPPLARPEFGSSLESLRLHLLRSAPPPFRRRNLFIDASVGDRV